MNFPFCCFKLWSCFSKLKLQNKSLQQLSGGHTYCIFAIAYENQIPTVVNKMPFNTFVTTYSRFEGSARQ